MEKNVFSKIKTFYTEKVRRFVKPVSKYSIVNIIVLAIVVNFLVECFSRLSLPKAIVFAFTKPHIFLYGALIITMTLSLGLVMRRRYFWYLLISVLWLAGGITNCIVLSARVTPFTFTDIVLLGDALALWHLYYSKTKMFLIVAGIIMAVVAVIVCWFLLPKYKGKLNRLKGAVTAAVCAILVYLITFIYLQTGIVKASFANIAKAYLNYGFTYCFSGSIINRGVSKPKGYSAEIIEQIMNGIANSNGESNDVEDKPIIDPNADYPNVIFVQLESFFDPKRLEGIVLSENPTPYMDYLRRNYPNGYLSVPSFGAGTANVEVEVVVGMNMDDFGTGEYPYKTIFNKKACESAAFNLKEVGYTAHAIHNNTAAFYSRNVVFSNLGFDTYTPVEYMIDAEKNPTGWAKDTALVGAIMDCLDYSEGVDYIQAISVQAHGAYPSDYDPALMPIEVSGFADEDSTSEFRYYLNQIAEVDLFVQELVETVAARGEKSLIVFYGDHLPTFDLEDEDFVEGGAGIYQTEYVIWNNFDMEMEKEDLESFQLTAEVLRRIGISNGTLIEYHQTARDTEGYLANLKQLEYDMLYGDNYIYNGEEKYESSDMRYGVRDVEIKGVSVDGQELMVFGENLTEYSRVFINDEEYETEYHSDFLLKVKGYEVQDGDRVQIVQRNGKVTFMETDEIVYKSK